MAEVIKSGTPWHKEVVCRGLGDGSVGCGSHILITQYDIYVTYGGDDPYTTFTCPECGEQTDVKTNMEPEGTEPSETTVAKIKKQWKKKTLQWKKQKEQEV